MRQAHRQRQHGGQEGGDAAARVVEAGRVQLEDDVAAVAEARLDALFHYLHHVKARAEANHRRLSRRMSSVEYSEAHGDLA